jgi:hypothetical protein
VDVAQISFFICECQCLLCHFFALTLPRHKPPFREGIAHRLYVIAKLQFTLGVGFMSIHDVVWPSKLSSIAARAVEELSRVE